MIEARTEPTPQEREAAEWYTRLLSPPVENEELEAFQVWRLSPENLAAYNRIEDIGWLALSLQDDPEMRAIADAVRKPASPSPPWYKSILGRPRQRWAIGIAIAGLATASAVVWNFTAPTYSTAVGQQIAARLPDGTQVRLNTDTALKVQFKDGVRRVELTRGQAFFDVAHDSAHPFTVVVGDTEVRAIGTRFDVRRDDGGTKVVLAEGKVAVTERGPRPMTWTLSPGQALTTQSQGADRPPAVADVEAATGWTTGRLRFRNAPLAEAVAEANRYRRDKIVLDADAPANARVNGDFAIDDPHAFVAAVTTLYGLKSHPRPGGGVDLRGGGA